jgi:hypothetical protein
MKLSESVNLQEQIVAGLRARQELPEAVESHVACDIVHLRDGVEIWRDHVVNQITNSGRDFMHQQCYQTSGLGANGLNYIALTDSTITPAPGDTTLAGEITTNGLGRAQGAVAHTAGTNTTSISNTFTCITASQAAKAAALFTAASVGTMNHEINFTAERTLQITDQLVITFTITLG